MEQVDAIQSQASEKQRHKGEGTRDQQNARQQQYDLADHAEETLKQWFLAQNIETKLAVVLVRILQVGDYGTENLVNEICEKYEHEITQLVKEPPADMSPEFRTMLGMLSQLAIWQKHFYR